MKDMASDLQRLVVACENVLALRPAGEQDELDDICNNILAWFAAPTDSERLVHRYTLQLAEAMNCAAQSRRHGRAYAEQIYFRIVGVILPDVRTDFSKAIEQRNRPTP